ncbi:MAG: TetR/AcrR family transcriptional regulator [Kofleriaceae bacterium]
MTASRLTKPSRKQPRTRARKPAEVVPVGEPKSQPPSAEKKSEATRKRVLERALVLFQKRGVDETTMRDIAKAAGLSLGAAYYYFPSKDALVFAYYEDNQRAIDEVASRLQGTVRERLGGILHAKLESIRPQRRMLASIIKHLVDPGDPLSTFSPHNRAIRERAIAVFAHALDGAVLPETIPLVANTLWLFQLAAMLLYVNDDSTNQGRTHRLVDEALDLVVPMLPVLAMPFGRALCHNVSGALERAGLTLASVSAH